MHPDGQCATIVAAAAVLLLSAGTASAINTPTPVSPASGATDIGVQPTLKWQKINRATYYQWRLAIQEGDGSWTNLVNPDSPESRVDRPADNPDNVKVEVPFVLKVSRNYRWSVRAINGNNGEVSGFSPHWTFTTKPPLPAPAIVGPVDGTRDVGMRPALIWGAVDGAVRYEVDVDGPNMPGPAVDVGNRTSIHIAPDNFGNDLDDGELTYTWRVRAMGNKRHGHWSPRATITTKPRIPAPVPTGPSATDRVSLAPTLRWNQVDDETNYEVKILAADGTLLSTQQVTGTSVRLDSDNFPDMPRIEPSLKSVLLEDTRYQWRVRVKKALRDGILSDRRPFTTRRPLQAPEIVAPKHGTANVIVYPKLEWLERSNATGYDVEVRGIDDPAFFQVFAYGHAEEHKFEAQLVENHHYEWRVRGKTSVRRGAWSAWQRFRIRPPIPAPVPVRPETDDVRITRPVFEWQPIPNRGSYNCNDYQIEVQKLDPVSGLPVGNPLRFRSMPITGDINDTTVRPSEQNRLDPNSLYLWRVRGIHYFEGKPNRVGIWSAATRFSTNLPITGMTYIAVSPLNPGSGIRVMRSFTGPLGPAKPNEPFVFTLDDPLVTGTRATLFTDTAAVTRVTIDGSGHDPITWDFDGSGLTVYEPGLYTFTFQPYDDRDRPLTPVRINFRADRLAPQVSWPTAGLTRTYSGRPVDMPGWGRHTHATWIDRTGETPSTEPVDGAVSYDSSPTGTGTHKVRATFAPTDTVRYRTISKEFTVRIDPAPLTVIADDAARFDIEPDPVFTADISGFVNGETAAAVLTSPVAYRTEPIPGSTDRRIVPHGATAANYTVVEYIPGTLTVTAAPADLGLRLSVEAAGSEVRWLPVHGLELYYSHNLHDWFRVPPDQIIDRGDHHCFELAPGAGGTPPGTYFKIKRP